MRRNATMLFSVAALAVLVARSVYFSGISKTDEDSYPLYDFTSSGLTHVNQSYASVWNPHRIAGLYVSLNFGLVEIDWNAERAPLITLKVVGTDGMLAFEYRISLDNLKADGGTA